jgi:hypothetical protein
MEGFFEEELFWEKLLNRGDFVEEVEELLVNGDLEVEEGLFVEQLLANKDFEEVEEWQLVAPNSFFDSFHFSSM